MKEIILGVIFSLFLLSLIPFYIYLFYLVSIGNPFKAFELSLIVPVICYTTRILLVGKKT